MPNKIKIIRKNFVNVSNVYGGVFVEDYNIINGMICSTMAYDDIFSIYKDTGKEMPEMFVIHNLYINKEFRHQGHGSALIKDICNMHNNELLVAIIEVSTKEYPGCPIDNETINIVTNLKPFWIKNNFICINDKTDTYEFTRRYLFLNEKGKELQRMFTEE